MRCKRHSLDLSSNIGVCASCLRERLFSLAAHQNDVAQPPLVFPRSVSPYVAPRKSSASSRDSNNTRFFSTPQVVSSTTCSIIVGEEEGERSLKKKKKKTSHLTRFSRFFRTRSDVNVSSSRSWLSKILSLKPKTNTCYIEDLIESESESSRPRQRFCRGMSPSESQRRTPAMMTTMTMTPGRRKTTTFGLGRSVSEMGFCLSPLVRAKPMNRKGKFTTEFGYSGELKSPSAAKPHLSNAASFCANRSKKLVDLGRLDHRR